MRDRSSPSGGAGTRRLACGVVAACAVAFAPSLLVSADDGDVSPTRTFTVTASRYAFDPDRIEVRQGDHVRLVLRSADTTHGLGIEAYGVDVVSPKGGEEVSVEFMAHRPGTFRIKCSEYCGSGHRRMQGRLVVTEAGQ
jgi:cytochrome c oxidase subunit 2